MTLIALEQAGRGRARRLTSLQWMLIGILALALGFGGWSLRGSLARTVTITEAKQASGTVQVFGYLYSQGAYDDTGNWTFDIQDMDYHSIAVSSLWPYHT